MTTDHPDSKGRPKTIQFDTDAERNAEASRDRRHVVATVLEGVGLGTLLVLADEPQVIGRDPSADLALPDPGISSRHLRLFRMGTQHFVEDLRSTNGTFLNGVRITDIHPLRDGDRMHIGRTTVIGFRVHSTSEVAAIKRLYESSVVDALTGVYNRRHFEDRLVAEAAYSSRHNSALALLLLDVDHFKRVNDTHGHPAGDAVLRHLGELLRRQVRAEDIPCRFGGEEFGILARGIGADSAAAFAERLRASVERAPIVTAHATLQITVSIGVATTTGSRPSTGELLVATADRALYQAKSSGRNRACILSLDDLPDPS